MRAKKSTGQAGVSLIELLIVMAIIAILACIVIPAYKSSVRKANQAAAIAAVNTIKVAQAKYAMDHQDRYGTFLQLVESRLLDQRFKTERPHLRGYVYVLSLIDAPEKSAATFKLNVNPEISNGVEATGEFYYYSEPDSPIFVNSQGPASAADEML